MYHVTAILTVPPQDVYRVLRPWLLKDDADRVCKADRVVRCVGRQEEQRVLVYGDVDRCMRLSRGIHRFQQHGALVLVEEFWCGVDVVVGAGVRPTHHHDRQAGGFGGGWMINAIVVDGRLKEMRVLLKPVLVSGCHLNGRGVSTTWAS